MSAVVDPPRLFVYGTLMPGRRRWPLLAPFVADHRPASAPGALYDSGRGWPVAVFDESPTSPTSTPADPATVPGVVVDLAPRRASDALALLDQVEGTATGLLRRIALVTGEGVDAWAYHHFRGVEHLVRIHDWATVPLSAEA